MDYPLWRFNLWAKQLPDLDTYNKIEFWLERGVLKAGEIPSKEEWETRLQSYTQKNQ